MNTQQRLLVVGPGEGSSVDLAGLGVQFKVWSRSTGGEPAKVVGRRRQRMTSSHCSA